MAFGFAGAFIVVASTSLMYFLKYLVINLDTDVVDRGSGAAITFGIFVIITGIFIYTAAYLEIFGPDVIRRESDIDAIKASYDEEINNLKERLKEIPQPRT